QLAWQEGSQVAMTPLSDAALDAYLATRVWQGCSGAYAIEEQDDPYVRVVQGSLTNVIGLPMETTRTVLRCLADLPVLGRGGVTWLWQSISGGCCGDSQLRQDSQGTSVHGAVDGEISAVERKHRVDPLSLGEYRPLPGYSRPKPFICLGLVLRSV